MGHLVLHVRQAARPLDVRLLPDRGDGQQGATPHLPGVLHDVSVLWQHHRHHVHLHHGVAGQLPLRNQQQVGQGGYNDDLVLLMVTI